MEQDVKANIRMIRILKNISQEHMAETLGISQSSYGKLERGATNLTMQRLDRIAKILGMTPFEIVNFSADQAGYVVSRPPEPVAAPAPVSSDPQVEILQEKIKYLEETTKLLQKQLADKDTIIEMLRG